MMRWKHCVNCGAKGSAPDRLWRLLSVHTPYLYTRTRGRKRGSTLFVAKTSQLRAPCVLWARSLHRPLMAINFTQPQGRNKSYIRQVTSWVEDELPESLVDAMVMVNELQCFEPVRTHASSHGRLRATRALVRLRRRLSLAHVSRSGLVCLQGCAPLETVISILGPKSHVFKIFKPVKEVMPEEVITAVQNALSGTTSQQAHIVQQNPPG